MADEATGPVLTLQDYASQPGPGPIMHTAPLIIIPAACAALNTAELSFLILDKLNLLMLF